MPCRQRLLQLLRKECLERVPCIRRFHRHHNWEQSRRCDRHCPCRARRRREVKDRVPQVRLRWLPSKRRTVPAFRSRPELKKSMRPNLIGKESIVLTLRKIRISFTETATMITTLAAIYRVTSIVDQPTVTPFSMTHPLLSLAQP